MHWCGRAAALVLVACGPTPIRTTAAPHRAEVVVAPTTPVVEEPLTGSREELVKRFYALAERDVARARAVLRAMSASFPGTCDPFLESVNVAGGFRAYASRGAVDVDEAGQRVRFTLYANCTLFANASVRVAKDATGRMHADYGAHEIPIDTPIAANWSEAIGLSDGVLARGSDGSFQWIGAEGVRVRGAVSPGDAVGFEAWGPGIVWKGEPSFPTYVTSKGVYKLPSCGRVTGFAVATPSRLIVSGVSGSATTSVCIVDRISSSSFATRPPIAVGSAVCGLAKAMPCPFTVALADDAHAYLNSMRGSVVAVDTTRAQRIDVPAVPNTYQGNGSGFRACEHGVCLTLNSTENESGEQRFAVAWQGGRMILKPIPAAASDLANPLSNWCERAGIPVPPAFCEEAD